MDTEHPDTPPSPGPVVPGVASATAPAGDAPAAGPPTAAPPVREIVPPVRLDRVPWAHVALFMLISYGLLALFALPFWILADGIRSPLFTPLIAVGMWAPAIASIVLAKAVERTNWRTRVGLRFRGRWRGILLWSPLAVLIVALVHAAAAVIMVLRGVPGDLTGATWLALGQSQLSGLTGTPVPAAAVVLVVAVNAVIGLVVTFVAAMGEEIGWRGWLWPALRPLGRVRAMIVMGLIWSLWHLPVVLIGYNYPGVPRYVAIPMFVLPCIAMSLLFCGFTDRAGGSPIPAAWGHSALNSLGGIIMGIVSTTATGAALAPLIDGPLGVTGAVLLLIAGILVTPWHTRAPIVRGLSSGRTSGRVDA